MWIFSEVSVQIEFHQFRLSFEKKNHPAIYLRVSEGIKTWSVDEHFRSVMPDWVTNPAKGLFSHALNIYGIPSLLGSLASQLQVSYTCTEFEINISFWLEVKKMIFSFKPNSINFDISKPDKKILTLPMTVSERIMNFSQDIGSTN